MQNYIKNMTKHKAQLIINIKNTNNSNFDHKCGQNHQFYKLTIARLLNFC